jgi:PIN domain nuclease of toxin-antitoxin system
LLHQFPSLAWNLKSRLCCAKTLVEYRPCQTSEWLTAATTTLREAPLTHEIVLIAQELPLQQRDPAHRFLATTAQITDLTLVTADDSLLRLGTIRTMKN